MKTIVKAAILALLAAALIGAAQAGRQVNTSNNSEAPILVGETDVTIADDAAGQVNNLCAAGSLLKGRAGEATETMGSKSIAKNFSTTALGLVAGTYDLVCKTEGTGVVAGSNKSVSLVNPSYNVVTYADVSGSYLQEIGTVASGSSLQVNASNTINDIIAGCRNTLKLRLKGTSPNKLSGISPWSGNTTDIGESNEAPGTGKLSLTPSSNWPAGDYEFILDPDGLTCNGIDADSPVLKTLKVVSGGVTLTVDKSTPTIDEILTITGSTGPLQDFELYLRRGNATKVEVVTFDASSIKFLNATNNLYDGTINATHSPQIYGFKNGSSTKAAFTFKSKSSGSFVVQVRLRESGNFEFRVNGTVAGGNVDVSQSVNVQDKLTTVRTARAEYILGDDVEITGSASAGDRLAIVLNNRVYWNDVIRKADGTFSQKWSGKAETAPRKSTGNFSEGPITVKVWVCPATVDLNGAGTACNIALDKEVTGGICSKGEHTDQSACSNAGGSLKGADATWSLSLREPTVEVSSPTSGFTLAKGDSFDVKGSAPGAEKVFLWVFSNRGTTSDGTCRVESVSATLPDKGYAFEKKFGTEITDKIGDYTLVVQSLGRDGVYSDGKQSGNTADPHDNAGAVNNLRCNDDAAVAGSGLSNKVGSQILSILQDNALNKAGSDDQKVFKVVQFKVVTPSIKLDACPVTLQGKHLVVNGTSNRADGTTIQVRATGPRDLTPKTTTVANGTFKAEFAAEAMGADIGTYTVTADDLAGRTDTVTCSVVTGTSCALNLALTSDKTRVEKDEKARLTATLSNPSDEACTGAALTSSVDPASGATVKWDVATVDVPAKGSATVSGDFYGTADGAYRVTLEAKRGTAVANSTATIGVGAAAAATPPPAGTATPTPAGTPSGVVSPLPATKPSPGFEALFAIAGLLAVACLTTGRKGS